MLSRATFNNCGFITDDHRNNAFSQVKAPYSLALSFGLPLNLAVHASSVFPFIAPDQNFHPAPLCAGKLEKTACVDTLPLTANALHRPLAVKADRFTLDTDSTAKPHDVLTKVTNNRTDTDITGSAFSRTPEVLHQRKADHSRSLRMARNGGTKELNP